MTRRSKPPLQPGDRVIERERVPDHVATIRSPNFKQVQGIIGNRRRGLVTGVVTKANRRGATVPYAQVIWDGLATPSLHAQCRLEVLTSGDQ